jgi:cell wall-associated NlpC family hydrolase
LRSFPTDLRVFRSADDTNIDRFQENALFPGTPVIVAHESKDRNWWFVVSPLYAAWTRKEQVALGDAAEVMAYSTRAPYRVVTGATVRTVFTPERPALSELQLDMGVRVPLAGDWPLTEPVNGQNSSGNVVIELPVRNDDGGLRLAPALLQANADTEPDYLPLTRGNIIRQGFKFLGERYGWGHAYNARDCSGFVSEVYRSMGVLLPRNTADQSVSPALDKTLFSETDTAEERMQAIRDLEVGDLVYIPGHVMMVIGFDGGEPWVIHDTTAATFFDADEQLVRVSLHAVSVTPLLPLRADEDRSYVDRMTSIVRVSSARAGSQPPP